MAGYDAMDMIRERIFDGDLRESKAVLVVGAPRCGKTEFAVNTLVQGIERFGSTGAVLTVSNRTIADELGNRVIRRIGATSSARPVTTMSAVAFSVIADARLHSGETAPRLLNGAEQDALLRHVVGVHLRHVKSGDVCDTCLLLREYFADDQWTRIVVGGDERSSDSDSPGLAEQGISSAWVGQLRDMLARINELGADVLGEDALLDAARRSMPDASRIEQQWRLMFALRREYLESVAAEYPNEYRLDASQLMIAAVQALQGGRHRALPTLVIIDDYQDTTLAGMRFLEALADAGVRLVLVGNPDESVQTFRGAYPEYVFRMSQCGPLQAALVKMPFTEMLTAPEARTYGALVSSRISLSIASTEDESTPLPARPGKLPPYPGAYPIAAGRGVPQDAGDSSVRTALYRSSREEVDDVVWRIKRMHVDRQIPWNDMAVIAHDNATVRVFGERLRRDGVPVRYSSITRPLKDEPFIQGLFALIELASLRRQGGGVSMTLSEVAAYVRPRVSLLMSCPLITVAGRPARLEAVEAAMDSLESLAAVLPENAADGGEASNRLRALIAAWQEMREAIKARHDAEHDETVGVDDILVNPLAERGDRVPFGKDAIYVMLALDDEHVPSETVLEMLSMALRGNPQERAFRKLWELVATVAGDMGRLVSDEPQYVLSAAWQAVDVADRWQRDALFNTADGRAANDRLDAAMRLFQYAQGSLSEGNIHAFIRQVQAMQIEADSLARIRPLEQAVTLSTPAGAVGRHWKHVWLPAVQQGVWPNMAERNTLFGGEDLVEIVLYGEIRAQTSSGHDLRQLGVLSNEKKSLLVAMTRADERNYVSAVWNDELAPSDFLFTYMPERFPRDREQACFSSVGLDEAVQESEGVNEESYALYGLDARPRDLVAAARVMLAVEGADTARGRDAASALAMLARHGVESADPDNWAFRSNLELQSTPEESPDRESDDAQTTDGCRPVVTLSPSTVDNIWQCPVCWLLDNRFAGPRVGSAAMSFGTLIHAVAQRGSEEGVDRSGYMPETSGSARVDAIYETLSAIYDELKPDITAIDNPRDRYRVLRRFGKAPDALRNIATYFASGYDDGYLDSNAKYFSVGTLTDVRCEERFAARFDLKDILAAYNALPGIDPVDQHELTSMMGVLVGGWPDGMSDDLTIRLTGRIDRMETRRQSDGTETIRLVDYKTGNGHTAKQQANDLQLVCYQLGLAFPGNDSGTKRTLANAPVIGQCCLFDVEQHGYPAQSYAPEGAHQPALFRDGHLNDSAFVPRRSLNSIGKVLDVPVLPESAPEGVGRNAWNQFVSLRGSQTIWALTMIARVVYAGAVLRSTRLEAHPASEHAKYCHNTLCPACMGQIGTVFEMRKP